MKKNNNNNTNFTHIRNIDEIFLIKKDLNFAYPVFRKKELNKQKNLNKNFAIS